MTGRPNNALWMTEFLLSPDPVKEQRIREVEREDNPELMNSILFHLSLRNQVYLLRRRSGRRIG
ncbi:MULTISPECIES: hypothetical protein [Saccharibacillus]|uniref:Uncharacterized protein n=1 Tax=Saccharibacillus brassicae TaxID=2583377 RepID=A0A4Y6UYB9_SACBS|nr:MULTISPECIES: hypothetical protein [Saccharibacillus]MWJ33090.1 hypothetical protein [Saccharibacillus sp. WB 17]QDH22753.1 hypothetical protein FFV09_19040 [Saccharibacillus brassicae]